MPRLTTTVPPEDILARLVGQPAAAIDTPALVLDLDAMQRNLARMAEFCRKRGLRWRPHAKMHKSASLARSLVHAGAVGACVQKTSEAEIMAAGGVNDIYISNEVVAPQKLARVAQLAHWMAANGGQLAIAVDSIPGITRLAQAMDAERRASGGSAVIDVFVEIDVGQGRCGVPPGPAAVPLALEVRKHPALRFAGLQAYHGRAQHLRTPEERHEAVAQAARAVLDTRRLIEAEGVPVGLVTGGGTGTMVGEAASGVWGELQAGSFLFMDNDYALNERDPAQPQFEHALFVKSQVMSVTREHVVCDAGHKSHAIDSGLPRVHRIGGTPDLVVTGCSDEHATLRAATAGGALPALGDIVWLIPGHCDPTVNLHDQMVGVRGGLLDGTVERIVRVDARGALT